MVVVLTKLGRLEEAARIFAEVRTHPNFDLADSRETLRELTNAAGGDAELDARSRPAPQCRRVWRRPK